MSGAGLSGAFTGPAGTEKNASGSNGARWSSGEEFRRLRADIEIGAVVDEEEGERTTHRRCRGAAAAESHRRPDTPRRRQPKPSPASSAARARFGSRLCPARMLTRGIPRWKATTRYDHRKRIMDNRAAAGGAATSPAISLAPSQPAKLTFRASGPDGRFHRARPYPPGVKVAEARTGLLDRSACHLARHRNRPGCPCSASPAASGSIRLMCPCPGIVKATTPPRVMAAASPSGAEACRHSGQAASPVRQGSGWRVSSRIRALTTTAAIRQNGSSAWGPPPWPPAAS